MDINNENDDGISGACSVFRFSEFDWATNGGWNTSGKPFKDVDQVLSSMLNCMADKNEEEYNDAPDSLRGDEHGLSNWLLSQIAAGESRFEPTHLLTAIVTSKQSGYPFMESLVRAGVFESFTSKRPKDTSAGDLTFFVGTVSQFLAYTSKHFKPKPTAVKTDPVPVVKKTKRTRA